MTEQLKALIENITRRYGVTIEVGAQDKDALELLKKIAREKNGRVDIIDTKQEVKKFDKHGHYNLYSGPSLYWTSSIPNLEYDVVYLEHDANIEGETFIQLLHEFWQIVHVGGVLCGDLPTDNVEGFEQNLKKALGSSYSIEESHWQRLK